MENSHRQTYEQTVKDLKVSYNNERELIEVIECIKSNHFKQDLLIEYGISVALRPAMDCINDVAALCVFLCDGSVLYRHNSNMEWYQKRRGFFIHEKLDETFIEDKTSVYYSGQVSVEFILFDSFRKQLTILHLEQGNSTEKTST